MNRTFNWIAHPIGPRLRPAVWMFALLTLGAAPLAPAHEPSGHLSRFDRTERHMGVDFSISLYSASEELAEKAFTAAFSRIHELEGRLSDYDELSETCRVGAQSPTKSPVPISGDLAVVLKRSLEVSRDSQGAFDCTVGPLTKLWRKARRLKELPEADLLERALKSVGYQRVELDYPGRMVTLREPGMRFDFGGIAKGFAADEAYQVLREMGIRSALVDASGDIYLGDPPPGASGWNVGIAPLEAERVPEEFLTLSNIGVATSGDAFRGVEIDGKRYSHIVDPKTGIGLPHRSSVTVIAPDAIEADAFATACSVLPPDDAVRLVEGLERAGRKISVRIISKVGEVTREWRSEGFPQTSRAAESTTP